MAEAVLTLKSFTFRTQNVEATVDFWTNIMKMDIEGRRNVGSRTRVSFKFPDAAVSLRFEEEHAEPGARRSRPLEHAAPQSPLAEECVICSVSGLADVLKRARQARFCVYVDAMAVGADQRAAVLLDPNGIRVKLFESAPPAPGVASAQSPLPELGTSAAAIVEASAAASAASSRLVALEVSVREMQALEKAVTFYDSLVPARAELDDAAAPASSRRNSLFAQLRMQSFRLVDHESFLSDMVTYAWLANGPRSARTALCLVHARAKLPPTHSALLRGDAATAPSAVAASGGGGGGGGGGGSGSGGSGGGGSGAGRVVLGLGFRVHDLEKTLATLRTQAQESVGTLQMQFIAGFPRFASFADPAGLVVELTDEQMRQPNAPQPQPQQQHQPSAGRSSRAQ